MEDRELLELAAKASGLKFRFKDDFQGGKVKERDCSVWWNPLQDDGDALRLAAKLRLQILPGKHYGDGCSVNPPSGSTRGVTVFRDSKDMAEQMRQAIVMTAAEIGKAMKEQH